METNRLATILLVLRSLAHRRSPLNYTSDLTLTESRGQAASSNSGIHVSQIHGGVGQLGRKAFQHTTTPVFVGERDLERKIMGKCGLHDRFTDTFASD